MVTTLGILVWSLILVSHGRILVIEPLLRSLVTKIVGPRPLTLLPYLPNFGLLNLLCIDNEPRIIHVSSIDVRHSFLIKLDTPITNLFILDLGLASMVRAHIESWVNLREYSCTLIPP